MTVKMHLLYQGLTLGAHAVNLFSGVVPAKYQPFVSLALALVNAGLAWYNHYFNPDGTPAQAAWTA